MITKIDRLPNKNFYNKTYRINLDISTSPNIKLVKEINDSCIRYFFLVEDMYEALVTEEFFYQVAELCNSYYEEDLYDYYYENETIHISVSKFGIWAEYSENLDKTFFE